jgi:hypothetical protein
MQIVRPRQMNFLGSPGSPIAIRDVSAVSVKGLMGSLMNRSDIIGILQGNRPFSGKFFNLMQFNRHQIT